MTIYFKTKPTEKIDAYLAQEKVPAHEKIGAIYTSVVEEIKQNTASSPNIPPLMQKLGIHTQDKTAIEEISHLLSALADGSLKIISTENTGVYFIQKQDSDAERTIAVYKLGRKRAAMELAARLLANRLGLGEHVIAGAYSALFNPPFVKNEETVEELWDGHEKIYSQSQSSDASLEADADDDVFDMQLQMDYLNLHEEADGKLSDWSREVHSSDSDDEYECNAEEQVSLEKDVKKTACAVVGIIQPFLCERPAASLYEFTLMTIVALAIGLRDGKKDGFIGSTLFDTEDCFPMRIDPIWSEKIIHESASAVDLPYLDQDSRTNTALTLEEVSKLAALVQQWSISEIILELGRLKIQYEDTVVDKSQPFNSEFDEEFDSFIDEGGNCVQVVKPEPLHLINGFVNHWNGQNARRRRILLPQQIDSLSTRLQRMRDFILACAMQRKTFTPQELVHAVDKWGKIYEEALRHSPHIPREAVRVMETDGVNHLTGRRSPLDLGVEIKPSSYSSESSPSPTGLIATLEAEAEMLSGDSSQSIPIAPNPSGRDRLLQSL